MNKLFTLLVLLSVFCLTGCLDYESRIQVKSDGSGYVVETLKFDKTMMDRIKKMAAAMSDKEQTDEEESMFKEQELREKSSNYGEGVTYVSGKAIKEDGKEGYTATYAFPDINKLTIGKKSLTASLSSTENDDSSDDPKSSGDAFDKMNFTFTKGDPSVLNFSLLSAEDIEQLANAEQEPQVEQDSMAAKMAMAMIKPMIKGLRIRFIVEPLGTIVETNATYRDKSQITLLDMDFETMFQSAQATRLPLDMSSKPKNLEEFNKLLTQTPGIKGQTGDVWVKFK